MKHPPILGIRRFGNLPTTGRFRGDEPAKGFKMGTIPSPNVEHPVETSFTRDLHLPSRNPPEFKLKIYFYQGQGDFFFGHQKRKNRRLGDCGFVDEWGKS